MTGIPTFATPPGFLGLSRHSRDAAIVVAGIPLDIGTTNRSGARFGPQAIRQASRMLVDGAHPRAWVDPAELDLADLGDFAIALGDIPASLRAIEEQAAGLRHLIALGGEHGITLPLLRAAAARRGGRLGLVHFDAHVDTWPDSFGQAFGHGSVFYHALREGLVDPRRMVQVGIRSPVQREVWDWTIGQGVTILSAEEVHEIGAAATAAPDANIEWSADAIARAASLPGSSLRAQQRRNASFSVEPVTHGPVSLRERICLQGTSRCEVIAPSTEVRPGRDAPGTDISDC